MTTAAEMSWEEIKALAHDEKGHPLIA